MVREPGEGGGVTQNDGGRVYKGKMPDSDDRGAPPATG